MKRLFDNTKSKCMISQPMNGLSDEEIQNARSKAIQVIQQMGYNFVSSYIEEDYSNDLDIENIGVKYLAESLNIMARCNAVYFLKGWEQARGCVIEHTVCKQYGIKCLYEE